MSDVKVEAIPYKVVPESKREKFIPNLVANNFKALMHFDAMVFNQMDNATEGTENEYTGGMWDFLEFENGAKAMVLSGDYNKVMQVAPQQNYYSGSMSQLSLCIAINICVCSRLSFAVAGAAQHNLAENYHLLREVADTLPDGVEIFGFID
jgi:hypothetical protein